jgi:phosphoserine phosphatase RsbU/P
MSTHPAYILIVDDNETNIQILAQLLEPEGYEIEYATSGRELFSWSADTVFDLILLDIMMPEMDGYEVCARLKSNPATASIPVIFITAKTDSESIDAAFAAGAVDYIAKPFNARELLSRVSVHISLHRNIIERQIAFSMLEVKQAEAKAGLASGKILQKAVLPSEQELQRAFPDNFVLYEPCTDIGGDFYWIKRIDSYRIALAVADCTGHGVPGALMSMFGIAQLHSISSEIGYGSPAAILEELRSRVITQLHQTEDSASNSIDLALAIIDTQKKTATCATADMPFIFFTELNLSDIPSASLKSRTISNVNRPDNMYFIDQNTSTAGYDIYKTVYSDIVIKYRPGDSLVMFSDGFKDQFGGERDSKFSKSRFINMVNNVSILPLEMQGQLMKKELDAWMSHGAPPTDDVTVLGIELY